MIKHPLQNSWTLWFFKNDKTKQWEENQREIITFNTVIFLQIKLNWHENIEKPQVLSNIQTPNPKSQIQNIKKGEFGLWAVSKIFLLANPPHSNPTFQGWRRLLTRTSKSKIYSERPPPLAQHKKIQCEKDRKDMG